MEALLTTMSFVLAICLQIFILGCLITRKLHLRFFWFLNYIVYALIEETVRLAVSGNAILYAHVYWWTEVGDVILSVLAMRESFLNTFRLLTRFRWFLWVVWCSVGAALLYAAFRAAVFPPLHHTRQGAIIIGLETAVDYSLAAVGIVYFAILLLSRTQHRPWEAGIVSGFTVNAVFAVLGLLTISIFGTKFRVLNEWIPAVAYIMAALEWAVVLSRPERTTRNTMPKLRVEDLTVLDQYKRTLQKFLGRKP
jgi:hypothetical protein